MLTQDFRADDGSFPLFSMASTFIPRAAFPTLDSLPRSYFLGHHRTGLESMKTRLSNVDIIIECRDYRIPLSSRNPLLAESLSGRKRAYVYTKRDLGSNDEAADYKVLENRQRRLHLSNWKLTIYIERHSTSAMA